ncbi:MAG: S-layer homology domain-containing protein, partial [Betaproteobacteria bacterium]
MMKRYMPIALVAILVLALAVPAAAGPFADVPENHWAYEAVKQLAAYGLVEGFPDGTFKGAEPMTRYQMAMVIARLLVSLDGQIKAAMEAARAGVTPAPAPAAPAAPSEKETVTVEKPVIEKVIEQTVVEKLKTEELDALTARVAGVEGRVTNVEGAVDAVSGKVDEVDKKTDDINAKLVELDGALALLEGDFNVKALELQTEAANGDADLAEKIAAVKAELEEKIASGDNELNAKIEAKAKELIALIDALKTEFNPELTTLGVRVVALEEQLALANSRIDDIEQKLGALDEKTTAIGTKLDEHIAGHEKVTISGSSELVLKDVDIYAEFDPSWNADDEAWESYAWVDPNDIFDDEDHSDGSYVPTSTFEHKLDLTLTARPADGVVVNATVGTVKKIYGADDDTDFALSDLSLDVTTPGVLAHLYAGGIVLPDGAFTPYTMVNDLLKDSDGNPLYEGVIAQASFGKVSGTTLFLREKAADIDPATYATYVCAGEGKVALTDNLKLSAAYVSEYDDPQSAAIDHGAAFTPVPAKDTVIGVAGSFGLASGWSVSGEFAKHTEYSDDVQTQTATAAKVDATGKISALELAANFTRVEDNFAPAFVNTDPDNGGITTGVKSISVEGKLPIGKLELNAGYKVEGDAKDAVDWDEWKVNTATAGAKYAMVWRKLRITPSVGLENALYVLPQYAPYDPNTNVLKLTGGVKGEYVAKFAAEGQEEVVPITAEYSITGATKRVGAGAPAKYYIEQALGVDAELALTKNLKLTGGYDWTKMDTDVINEDEAHYYGVVASNVSTVSAGVEASFPIRESTTLTGSYEYGLETDILNNYKPYSKNILKAGLSTQLTPKASVAANVGYYKLDRWDDADDSYTVVDPEQYKYAPLTNI